VNALTDFLLARIADDEAAARAAVGSSSVEWQADRYRVIFGGEWEVADANVQTAAHIARHDPARVLAECEAKRRIVEDLALPYIAERRRLMNGQPSWGDEHPTLLLLLALPYADHPDMRPEWRR